MLCNPEFKGSSRCSDIEAVIRTTKDIQMCTFHQAASSFETAAAQPPQDEAGLAKVNGIIES